MERLSRGDLLPEILTPPPGPRSRALCRRLGGSEAPSVNTLTKGQTATIVWAEARGANVLDVDGNLYLDGTSGFGAAAVGHRHPAVVAAVQEQSDRLLHGLADVAAHPARVDLAARLCRLAPVDQPRVHFAVSGADAVEIALATAYLSTGRSGVVAFRPAYHGTTLGALAVSSRPAFREPFEEWLNPRVVPLSYGAPSATLERHLESGKIGAVLVEPIAGREGILLPPPGWLGELARLCRRHGALLAVDEIFTGCARSGRLWALESDEVRPDLLICGKALGGGLPIAAVIGRGGPMAAWETEGEALHTATHLAQPLSCAAAVAVLEVIRREHLVRRAQELGTLLGAGLRERVEPHPLVHDVRGRGALWGLELSDAAGAEALVAAARQRGVLLLAGGEGGQVVQVCPPLAITDAQVECLLAVLQEALGVLAS